MNIEDNFEDNDRKLISDKYFKNIEYINSDFHNLLFVRTIAKDKKFKNVDFSHSIFDLCYFHRCIFESCDFTGCIFIRCNFRSAKFTGCEFQYAYFEKTNMNTDILTCNMPSYENIALDMARNLKKNYDQLGDINGLNKSICCEIDATKEHLYKSWNSNSAYYRSHYKSFNRFYQFLHWLAYKLSGFIWGHGEQVLNIIFFLFLFICIIASYLHLSLNYSIYESISKAFSIFLGNIKIDSFSNAFIDIISIVRYIFIALFVSILIKKTGYR